MAKTNSNVVTYKIRQPLVPTGVAGEMRAYIESLHATLQDLENQLNQKAVPGYVPPVKRAAPSP